MGLRLGLGKSLFPVGRPEIKGRISAHKGILNLQHVVERVDVPPTRPSLCVK